MRGSIFTILVSVLITAGFQVVAQGNNPVGIDIHASQTADAIDTTVRSSETRTPFEMTATALVIQSTQTAEALGVAATPVEANPQLVATTTTDPTSQPVTGNTGNSNKGGLSPLVFTFLMVFTFVFILGLVAFVVRVITSQTNGNDKSQKP